MPIAISIWVEITILVCVGVKLKYKTDITAYNKRFDTCHLCPATTHQIRTVVYMSLKTAYLVLSCAVSSGNTQKGKYYPLAFLGIRLYFGWGD